MAGTLRYVVTIRTARQLSLSKTDAAIFKTLKKFLTCLNFYCLIENGLLCILNVKNAQLIVQAYSCLFFPS